MDETCPGCGLILPRQAGPSHSYFGASPACWALFGDVLARDYADPALMAVHRLTVDAYAAQHPGVPGRRQIQSVWAHLAGLYCVIGRGLAPAFATRVLAGVTAASADLPWLSPPPITGGVTVADVLRANDQAAAVRIWAGSVWAAWAPHHAAVARLADRVIATL